jgi:hypothetical protein
MKNQIALFVEEIQEDEGDGCITSPILDPDDLDPEWEKLSFYSHVWINKVERIRNRSVDLSMLGFKSIPFSPPEFIDNF